MTFTTTLGAIDPREARTEGGTVTARLSAGGQSGTAMVGAFSGGARAEELEISIGGAAAEQVVLSANPDAVSAQGGSVELAALVTDASGNGLPGVPVQFATSAGTLSSSSVLTGSDGTARTTLTTTREAEVAAVGAQVATVTVGITAAPTVSVSADDNTPSQDEAVTFTVTANAGTDGAPVRSVTIDFGDGATQALGALSGSTTVSHSYGSPGTKIVTVTATDSAGESTSVSMVVAVQPRGVLSVSLTASPTSASAGTPLTFTAAVSPSDAAITLFSWNFGDGTTRTTTGGTTSHVYGDGGPTPLPSRSRPPTAIKARGWQWWLSPTWRPSISP